MRYNLWLLLNMHMQPFGRTFFLSWSIELYSGGTRAAGDGCARLHRADGRNSMRLFEAGGSRLGDHPAGLHTPERPRL